MINKKTVKTKNKSKTSASTEYRTVTVHKVEEDEEDGDQFDVTRGELVLFENENLFIESAFKLGCQFIILQGFRVSQIFIFKLSDFTLNSFQF